MLLFDVVFTLLDEYRVYQAKYPPHYLASSHPFLCTYSVYV